MMEFFCKTLYCGSIIVLFCLLISCDGNLVVPAVHAHVWGEAMTHQSTCVEAGYTYHICRVCGDIEKISDLAVASHSSEAWMYDALWHYKICEGCGQEFDRQNHMWNAERVCEVCGYADSGNGESGQHGGDGFGGIGVASRIPSYALEIYNDAGLQKVFLVRRKPYSSGVAVVWYVNGFQTQHDNCCDDCVALNYDFVEGGIYDVSAAYNNVDGGGWASLVVRF